MDYGKIPGFEKPISKLVLGADWFEEVEEEKAVDVLDAFQAAGGNCIDMAHVYGGGQGQRIVGRWVKSRRIRDRVVLLDKGCHPYGGKQRMTPEDLDADLNENLERLGLESIDLFVLHRDDPAAAFEPVVTRLNAHLEASRIRAFGVSNWHHARIAAANEWAASQGLRGFSLSSPNLSLAKVNEPRWEGCLTLDEEGRRWHAETQFSLFAWASQGGGYFTGVDSPDIRRVYDNTDNLFRRRRLEELALKRSLYPVNVALAWVLHQPFPTWALIGPRSVAELQVSLLATDVDLSPREIEWLEKG